MTSFGTLDHLKDYLQRHHMAKSKIAQSFGTHNGTFHADEVTACALLILHGLVDPKKVFRTRDPHIHSQCEFVCDVGGIYDPERKLFDHHQADYEGELSSAGMVLLYLKDQDFLSQREFDFFRNQLVMGVDAHDNGRDPLLPGYCSFSNVISQFVPPDYASGPSEQDAGFRAALDFTLGLLRRMKERFEYLQSCRAEVESKMAAGNVCLVFDRPLSWLEAFFELGGEVHPARFIIMPTGEHWKLRAVPPSYEDRMSVRSPLPAAWAGLLDEDLKRVSGIPGAIFCHKGRFISVWETKEDAEKALELTIRLGEVSDD